MKLYNQKRSEAVCDGRILFSLFVILSLMILRPSVSYGVEYEEYQRACTAVENLASEIRMGEGAVGQTLMEAMGGNHGEMNKWTAIDEKVSALSQSIDGNLPEIGKNAAIMLAFDPNANLPRVTIGQTFEGNLKMVRDQKKLLGDLAKAENAKIDKINSMIAKADKNLLNAARGLMGDTIEGFMPTEEGLAGEASVIVLGAYFGPPGIAAAGLAVGVSFTFNSLVSMYYNTQAAVEQAKVLAQMKQSLEASKKRFEENLKILMEGVRELTQIEQILDGHNKKMNEYRVKVNAAVEGWNGQSAAAFEKKKQALEDEAKKEALKPKPAIKMSSYAYGMEPIPPVEPGEYAGQISSMIQQLESFTKAVEDGGDPDNFSSMVTDWHNRLNDQYTKVREDYDKKYAAYGKACETTYNLINQASQEYYRSMAALGPFCWCDKAKQAAAVAISNRYNAAYNAAYAGLKPYGQALIAPYREMVKLSAISNGVQAVYYPFAYRITNAIQARSKEFYKEFELWNTKYAEVSSKTSLTVSDIPYWLPSWKERAAKIDSEVESALFWGSDIVSVRSGLQATANSLRETDKAVKAAAKAYAEANIERVLVSNQAQSELGSLLAKYGRLINFYWSSSYMPWLGSKAEFTPHAPQQEINMKYLTEEVKKAFLVTEPYNLEEAKKVDLIPIAQIYENKANELSFYTDWIEQYQNRLSAVAGRLDRISRKQTGTGLYAAREDVRATLDKEFKQVPFGGIMNQVDGLFTAEELGKLPWIKVQPWASMSPWQKLYAGQNVLNYKLHEDLKTYVQSRSQGWFSPARDEVIKPLEEKWKKLRTICEQYDAAAKPLSENIGNAAEEIGKESASLWETWNKMPALSRNAVSGQHSRFQAAYGWLIRYVTDKKEALKSTLEPPTNSIAVQLDTLISGYRQALEKYREQQAEQQRRFEEQQRRFAEEEKKRAEEERLRLEAIQKKSDAELNAVKDLYSAFKASYESRNDSQVISFMGDQWEAGDGTTLSDLQVNLSRSFRTFDDIKYTIQNLSITPNQSGRFNVSYDVTITSRIFRRNLKHEEKSSISEEVTIDSSGKAKITKTLGGRFWYVQ